MYYVLKNHSDHDEYAGRYEQGRWQFRQSPWVDHIGSGEVLVMFVTNARNGAGRKYELIHIIS